MNYSEATKKFTRDMARIINTWKGYEADFYNNTIIPICMQDYFLAYYLQHGKDKFPHNLWLIWVYGPWLNNRVITLDNLEQIARNPQYQLTFSQGKDPVKIGKEFENQLADKVLNTNVMQRLAKLLPGSLQHVGAANKREDFVLTEEYSLDVKYSGLSDDSRFKNIIKPWGSNMYTAVNKIEEGILRSMYKEGAQQGRYLPKATGQTVHHGILKYDKKTGLWSEATQKDYDDANFGPIPSLRKNILYLFNDDGYWASYCLERVVVWGMKQLENLGFTENTKAKDYQSYTAEAFWGFSKTEWRQRQLWYGTTK